MYEQYEFLTQTQLGEVFGFKRGAMGKILVEVGLRYRSPSSGRLTPSKAAFDGGYCTQGPSRGDGYSWVWHRERTVRALQEAGYPRVDVKPVCPSQAGEADSGRLRGPFSIGEASNEMRAILNGDGNAVVWLRGAGDAAMMLKLLNIVFQRGYFQ